MLSYVVVSHPESYCTMYPTVPCISTTYSMSSELKILQIFKKVAYRYGIKRKGDKIGMGYMKNEKH